MSPIAHTLEIADNAEAWESAGFSVVDSSVTIGAVKLLLVGAIGDRGILSWTLGAVDGMPVNDHHDLDGIVTHFRRMPPIDRTVYRAHPNGVTGIDMIVLQSPNPTRTLAAFSAIGLHPQAESGKEARKVRQFAQYFIRPSGAPCAIELVGPADGTGDGPARIWGLTFVCGDIDVTHGFLRETTKAPWNAVQKGRRMTVLQHKKHDISVACALISPYVKDDTPKADRDSIYAHRARE
eukprot:CAMPEP_0169119128 /NCGR_PEP_ID=MMETSP1015-20121227/31380_1 /TAXON_ID=342587 /ORGANISM="Karlodinium micrum, Strain CCMP2283" /LENGTH=236 /DNA_ID=CAMNT_0009181965 /DNA_START=46 /DNA_END=753 /DNA_ORIENTATION=+